MELSRYVLGRQNIIILPRFMRTEEYLPSLLEYLTQAGYENDDINVYPEIWLGIKQEKRTEIYLYDWYTHPRPLIQLLEQDIPPQIIYVSYIPEQYEVTFGKLKTKMVGQMSDLYHVVDDDQKLMFGNHYYGQMVPDDILKSLNDECDLPIECMCKSKNTVGIEDCDLDQIHVCHIQNYRRHGDNDHKSSRNLEIDSPKITSLIKLFTASPGKYVILTDYRGYYGKVVIVNILRKLFDQNVYTIDEYTEEDVANDIYHKFDQAEYAILVTCVVPSIQLTSVDNLVIFDNYQYEKVISVIRRCIQNLNVIFITEEHNDIQTIASIKADDTIAALKSHNNMYDTMLKAANHIKVKGNKLFVVS